MCSQATSKSSLTKAKKKYTSPYIKKQPKSWQTKRRIPIAIRGKMPTCRVSVCVNRYSRGILCVTFKRDNFLQLHACFGGEIERNCRRLMSLAHIHANKYYSINDDHVEFDFNKLTFKSVCIIYLKFVRRLIPIE